MNNNKVLGIVLTVLGVLVLFGFLSIPFLTEILGVACIAIGILILAGKQSGGTWWGVGLVAGGVLLLANTFGIASVVGGIITILVGIGLLASGVLKLMGRW